MSASGNQMGFALVAVLCISVGIALLLAALVIRMRDTRFRRTSLRAKASIVDRSEYAYEDSVQETTSLRFIDSKVEEIVTGIDSLRSLSKSKKRHHVGQVVDILYDPKSPYTSLRFSDSSPAGWIIIFAGTGLLSLVLGLLFALTVS